MLKIKVDIFGSRFEANGEDAKVTAEYDKFLKLARWINSVYLVGEDDQAPIKMKYEAPALRIMESIKAEGILYPVVIMQDRYMGVYSGGKWTAWNCEPDEIPPEVYGNDEECRNAWRGIHDGKRPFVYGFGDTIEDAISRMVKAASLRGK
jgi:hypothetical protein